MDYFFMNECIFKLLIKNKKSFVLKFLESIGIFILDYDLLDINGVSDNTKVDIILISSNKLINIEFNREKKSLRRNQIYIECISKLMPNFEIIQININLFEENNNFIDNIKIFNYCSENEYIRFLTSKNYKLFNTRNKNIKDVIKFIDGCDYNLLIKMIKKEHKIKEKIDNLITY